MCINEKYVQIKSSKKVAQIWHLLSYPCFKNKYFGTILKSTYAKVHGSVSVDALQRIEAEEPACGKVHDPACKITEIFFQEKWKMEITDLLGLILEISKHDFVEIFME